jgi:hypothetical protein
LKWQRWQYNKSRFSCNGLLLATMLLTMTQPSFLMMMMMMVVVDRKRLKTFVGWGAHPFYEGVCACH